MIKFIKIILFFLGFCFIFGSVFIFLKIPNNIDHKQFEIQDCSKNTNQSSLFSTLDSSSIQLINSKIIVPLDSYTISYCNFNNLEKDLDLLKDSLNFGGKAERLFYYFLVDKNKIFNTQDSNIFDPIKLLNWIIIAERSLIHATYSARNSYFFKAISRYYFNSISEQLTKLNRNDPTLKYDLNFKILVDRCRTNKYHVDQKFTNSEKLINYLVEKKYAYIINRFWIGTPAFFKIILCFGLLISLYAYYLLINQFINHFKKKK